jgi:hypothetical protein
VDEECQTTMASDTPIVDLFCDDRASGTVIGTSGRRGAVRLGRDVEGQIAIDHGALRFRPLLTPGWGRQGIAYGPFRRVGGLVLAVSITNGHNTSQGSCIPEHIVKRIRRWFLGPDVDAWPVRLAAWVLGPRRKGTLRRFRWWVRSTSKTYHSPNYNENLAVGWFTSVAPGDPLVDGCGFIVHAAEGENGELWARVGDRCLSAFRRLKNLQIYYIVALRERGAAYYAAASDGAHGLAGFPMMRPIAIDPFNSDERLYAGIHQCVLGQIGFRVDTRVHGVYIARIPQFAPAFGAAHAADSLTVGVTERVAALGDAWRTLCGHVVRSEGGAIAVQGNALAILDPGAPSGLIHALVESTDATGRAGLAWRVRDGGSYWLLTVSSKGCALVRRQEGTDITVASDAERRLKANTRHSVQVLDAHGQIGCYFDGERLFEAWFEEDYLEGETGVGVWLEGTGSAHLRDFEAHPREVAMPAAIPFSPPWKRLGERVKYADDFAGPPGDLTRHTLAFGEGEWVKTLGTGSIETDGVGAARVRATVERPNPGRVFYTLPWSRPDFADLETTITPPGHGRGQMQRCRSGLVFWQDTDNYVSFTVWLDDAYEGSSAVLFPKRHGFEELYDAIWTNIWDKVDWGKPFRLRVTFDGEHFTVFIGDEPVMQRSLTDIYPDDPPLRITRVGLAVNWEWGNDTGSRFEAFVARW